MILRKWFVGLSVNCDVCNCWERKCKCEILYGIIGGCSFKLLCLANIEKYCFTTIILDLH